MPEGVIIHKGMLTQLGREWLEDQLEALSPAFANEVFVILTRRRFVRRPTDSPHFKSFLGMLKALVKEPPIPSQHMSVYLGDHKALARTIYGHKIFVDTRDIGLTPHIMLDGVWKQWVTDTLRAIIKPRMTVVDIGANVGYHALLAAALVGQHGKLIAFEANPKLAEMMHATLSVNGFLDRVVIENRAVHSKSGAVPFSESSLYASDVGALHKGRIQMIDVTATSLDEYFHAGERIDVLKIDAEGSEPAIFKGAERVVRENKDIQIIMQFAPSLFKSSHATSTEFYDVICAAGLKIHRINRDGTLSEHPLGDLERIDQHWDVLLRRR